MPPRVQDRQPLNYLHQTPVLVGYFLRSKIHITFLQTLSRHKFKQDKNPHTNHREKKK